MQKGTKIFLTLLTIAVIGGLWLTWKHASAAAKRADDLEKQVEALREEAAKDKAETEKRIGEVERSVREIELSLDEKLSAVPEPDAYAKSGDILLEPSGEAVREIAVVSDLREDCYVRFHNTTRAARYTKGETDAALLCDAGKTVTVSMPAGAYDVWVCCGGEWKGTSTFFGEDTQWYLLREPLRVQEDMEEPVTVVLSTDRMIRPEEAEIPSVILNNNTAGKYSSLFADP